MQVDIFEVMVQQYKFNIVVDGSIKKKDFLIKIIILFT